MDGMIDPRPAPPATGCGYATKPGEMPLDTLRRMQRDRKF